MVALSRMRTAPQACLSTSQQADVGNFSLAGAHTYRNSPLIALLRLPLLYAPHRIPFLPRDPRILPLRRKRTLAPGLSLPPSPECSDWVNRVLNEYKPRPLQVQYLASPLKFIFPASSIQTYDILNSDITRMAMVVYEIPILIGVLPVRRS